MALYEVYVDGAARGQGVEGKRGHGACAIVICRNKKVIGKYARGLGLVTNNQAEYEAVIHALLMCWSANFEDPIIYSDSALVVKQVTGVWKCHNEELLPLLYSIKEIQDDYRFRIVNVKRNVVSEADRLANEMLDHMLEPTKKNKKRARIKKSKTKSLD